MKKKKLITSALPYVNNVPHLGNIIGCVLSADVYARFCRSRGYETLYVCGTDEYGTATENKAREEGLTPREICDKYFEIHRSIYKDFNISFDMFGRTSTPEQTEVAQSIFKDLETEGLILERTSERTYCEHDQMFLADRFVEGICPYCNFEDARGDQCDQCGKLLDPEQLRDPKCKLCKKRPVLKETTHLHLDLAKIQPKLEAWFKQTSKEGNWPTNALTTTEGWLKRGLSDRPITRDLKWGVPVPRKGFEDKVFYVWFDAPIGYISITKAHRQDWENWWKNPEETDLYQFMAKDNIPFHTVMFPASLIGSGKTWTLLHHISSTEYLNYEDSKFSKSRNIGVFGNDVKDTGIPTDLWRFYLLSNRPENNDSSFMWPEFITKVNSEFINNIGNMANRALVYLHKNFDGTIKDLPYEGPEKEFVEECKQSIQWITDDLENLKIRSAIKRILALGNEGNRFFQEAAPWVVIKENPEKAHQLVSILVYLVRNMAILLEPYMPETAKAYRDILNVDELEWDQAFDFSGLDGHQIQKPTIIYQNLDPKLADIYHERFAGTKETVEKAPVFVPKLTVAEIESVNPHPGADRLYILCLNTGDSHRQVVAGLVQHFQPEDLQNRKILLVTNLKPAVIRGTESSGMVLACEQGKKLDLFQIEAEIGTQVNLGSDPSEELDINQFKQAGLKVIDHQLTFNDSLANLNGNPVTSTLKNGKVR